MNPRDILIEFLEDAALDADNGYDALGVFEEWFDGDEQDFMIWCAIFSGYRIAKELPIFELDEALVNQVGDYLIGGGNRGLH